jgi:hypothetical protein
MALFFFVRFASAQVSDKIANINAGTYREGEPLNIQVELSKSIVLDRIVLAYRSFGQRDFKQVEMSLVSNTASATIPSEELTPPFLEYYCILYAQGSPTPETYPLENAMERPFKINLQSAETDNKEIIILSPERGERLNPEEFFISVSLVDADTSVDRMATKIYVDEADLSKNLVISEDLVTVPTGDWAGSLSSGNHAIRVELYAKDGKLHTTSSWNFAAAKNGVQPTYGPPSGWLYNGSVQLETRNENISSSVTPYNRGTLTTFANYGDFRFNGRLYVTNEEKDYRQPQNRFFIGGESPWLNAGYGDNYPTFPNLIMSGKRVRGFSGKLTLGAFNLDVSTGEIVRHIEIEASKIFPRDSLSAEQIRDSTHQYGYAIYDGAGTGAERWAQFKNFGTFSRDLLVVRPSLGREAARIGFTYLKSKDDIGSVRYGIKPQENLVIGSDLFIATDNRRVQLSGQVAFSLTNRDITRGTFTDTDIDSIFKDPTYNNDDRKEIRNIRDIASHFITVNENIVPLSLKNLSTLAYEAGLSLNYFNNYFKLNFLRHGNDYESFGQTFIRTDVAGFNLSDRQGLADNQFIVSAGIERLKDNTAETKAATTTYTTVNTAVSYYPRANLPNVTLAYLHAGNSNGINNNPPQHVDSIYAIDDNTDRIFVQIGHGYTFGARHNASLSFSTSTRDDKTLKDLDTKSTSFTLSNQTTYGFPLQTVISLSLNSNKFSAINAAGSTSISTSYTTLYGNAQYRLLEERLRLSGTISPTFGDLERTLFEIGGQYYFVKNLSAQTQLYLYFNKGGSNDTIWSFILRLDV